MMAALVVVVQMEIPVHGLLQCPTEAVTAVLVHSLDHEEYGANFEDRGANKSRYATSPG